MNLEQCVLEKIKESGTISFGQLFRYANSVFGGDNYRKVDRCLQRLRKHGAIVYDSKRGWEVKPTTQSEVRG